MGVSQEGYKGVYTSGVSQEGDKGVYVVRKEDYVHSSAP